MKKDINFLETAKQGNGGKQTNTIAIIVVVMIIALGVLTFVFFNTKGNLNTLKSEIADFEQEKTNPKYENQKAELVKAQSKLSSYISELYTKETLDALNKTPDEVSAEIFGVVISQCYNGNVEEIEILEIKFDEDNNNKIVLSCQTKKDATDVSGGKALAQKDSYLDRLNNAFITDSNDNEYKVVEASVLSNYEFISSNKCATFTVSMLLRKVNIEVA